ncbi:hypothetical protein [Neptunitalea lumnitzerae]|uniref:Lipoprotein n=1 Tax=Neptunitalea lumnitzerae TaxID=2965509 RepID=A0ABQ5MEG7_9FLAO|nr:hypothetical protein [Neptunitalea sp. Y10]GLB47774.1 hypothetical protein Y10_01420 [Neptunitalea sp. Y10]
MKPYQLLLALCSILLTSCTSKLEKTVAELNATLEKNNAVMVDSVTITGDKEVTYHLHIEVLKKVINLPHFEQMMEQEFYHKDEDNPDTQVFKDFEELTLKYTFYDRVGEHIYTLTLAPGEY